MFCDTLNAESKAVRVSPLLNEGAQRKCTVRIEHKPLHLHLDEVKRANTCKLREMALSEPQNKKSRSTGYGPL